MVFDRALRNPHLFADLAVGESLQVTQRKDLAAFGREGCDRLVDTRAQILRVELFDDRIPVGIVIGVADAFDTFLVVGAVTARMAVLVDVVDRLVVDRTQQVAVERLPGRAPRGAPIR